RDGSGWNPAVGDQSFARADASSFGGSVVSAALANRMFLSLGKMFAGLSALAGGKSAGSDRATVFGADCSGAVAIVHGPQAKQAHAGALPNVSVGVGQSRRTPGGDRTAASPRTGPSTEAQNQKTL